MDKEKTVYILDALAEKYPKGIFSVQYSVTEIAKDFYDWAQKEGITRKMLWIANVYERDTGKHIAVLDIDDNGNVIVSPAPFESTIKPFVRHLTPRQRILDIYWRIVYRIDDIFRDATEYIKRNIGIETDEGDEE